MKVSLGLIAGVAVVIICLAVGAALGGFFWNRKRKSVGVVTLYKVGIIKILRLYFVLLQIKDNAGASKSFLEDSEVDFKFIYKPDFLFYLF